jgi:hypothetical protein
VANFAGQQYLQMNLQNKLLNAKLATIRFADYCNFQK